MRSSIVLLALLLISMIFVLWPGTSQFNQSDWSYIKLSPDEIEVAIDNYKQDKYLNEIGYYSQRFPFSSIITSTEQYVWLIIERLDYIVMIVVCVFWTPPVQVIKAYLVIKSLDIIDHLIHYNEPYFHWRGIPVSFNVISIPLFALYLLTFYISRKPDIPNA